MTSPNYRRKSYCRIPNKASVSYVPCSICPCYNVERPCSRYSRYSYPPRSTPLSRNTCSTLNTKYCPIHQCTYVKSNYSSHPSLNEYKAEKPRCRCRHTKKACKSRSLSTGRYCTCGISPESDANLLKKNGGEIRDGEACGVKKTVSYSSISSSYGKDSKYKSTSSSDDEILIGNPIDLEQQRSRSSNQSKISRNNSNRITKQTSFAPEIDANEESIRVRLFGGQPKEIPIGSVCSQNNEEEYEQMLEVPYQQDPELQQRDVRFVRGDRNLCKARKIQSQTSNCYANSNSVGNFSRVCNRYLERQRTSGGISFYNNFFGPTIDDSVLMLIQSLSSYLTGACEKIFNADEAYGSKYSANNESNGY